MREVKWRNGGLLIGLLVAIWWVVPLWMYGTFDDGTFYASIARNLIYDRSGSWWDLKVSNALDPTFYGHPPLAFWLQSFFFALLGDVYWVERVYSLCMAGLTLWGIHACWRLLHEGSSHWAMLAWLSIPIVGWSYANNMLENTLTVLTTFTVWWMLYGQRQGKAVWWMVLSSGGLIFLATLVKGPVGLFPLVTLGLYALVMDRHGSWRSMLWQPLAVLGVIGLGYGLLLGYSAEARHFYGRYWELQLMGSLGSESNLTPHRLAVVQALVEETLIAWAMVALAVLSVRFFKKAVVTRPAAYHQKALFWLGMGLSASLPLIISPKQLRFYIVPASVFLALAAAAWMAPYAQYWSDYLRGRTWWRRGSAVVLGTGIVACLALSWLWRGENARRPLWLGDSRSIGAIVPPHTEIYIHPDLFTRWELHGYMYRYFYIDLSFAFERQPYALMPKDMPWEEEGYEVLHDSLQVLRLYQLVPIEE